MSAKLLTAEVGEKSAENTKNDMKVFRKLEEIPADFGPSLVSVGNFDGVHLEFLPLDAT